MYDRVTSSAKAASQRQRVLDRWPTGGIEPLDVRLRAEPCPLALREGLVAADVLRDCRVGRQLTVEDGPRLAVADRRECREGRVEARAKRARFVDQAGVELGAGPVRDPLSVCRRVDC